MSGFPMRIGMIGTPSQPEVEWTPEAVQQLRAFGFTAVQLNIAWSYRPNDEPLNLEDVIAVRGAPPSSAAHGDEGRSARLETISRRATIARDGGLRTLLHVGLPFQGRAGFDGAPLPQCISDPEVLRRYETALRALAVALDPLDDLLIYTYDQDAWLCSEFEGCDRCSGRPLHRRITVFLNALAAVWSGTRAGRRLWWEPWELSAGQALACIPLLDAASVGLMLHSNVGEVITTEPGDHFVRNAASLARRHSVPVVVEVFLSSSNEEVEPWTHLPVPLVTLDQLRAVSAIPGVIGVKEYFGLRMDPLDVNLSAARGYFADPLSDDGSILEAIAESFGHEWLPAFWTIASDAYRLYPWDSSWFARQLGRSQPLHELSAATVRGTQTAASAWDTPAWRSSRLSVFMRTDDSEPHPWLLEDVALRSRLAAERMTEALDLFTLRHVPSGRRLVETHLAVQRLEAEGFVTRASAYSLHIRATLLARLLRGRPGDAALLRELEAVLRADLENHERELRRARALDALEHPRPAEGSILQKKEKWIVDPRTDLTAITEALQTLADRPEDFLDRYLLPGPGTGSAGQFSLTSR